MGEQAERPTESFECQRIPMVRGVLKCLSGCGQKNLRAPYKHTRRLSDTLIHPRYSVGRLRS